MKRSRIEIEKETVVQMIGIYCKGHHKEEWKKKKKEIKLMDPSAKTSCLCDECADLQAYALKRLSYCKFGEEKKFCSQCPVHCYHPKYKEKVKKVMKYSGPRILFHHPILVIKHMFV